jgi:predicted  nucleic acid-binding Zn-ribbon protein
MLLACAFPIYSQSKTDGFILIKEETEQELRKNIEDYKKLRVKFDARERDYSELKKSYADLEKEYRVYKNLNESTRENYEENLKRWSDAVEKCKEESIADKKTIEGLRKSVWSYKSQLYALKKKKNRGGDDPYPPY